MKIYPVVAPIVALGLLALSGAALADNDSGLYLGVGGGQFNIKFDELDTLEDVQEEFDGDDTVYKAFAGWRFNPYIGIELDYMDLGAPNDTIDDINIEAKISGIAPYVIVTLPLGPIEFFGKAGYYFYDVELNAENLASAKESEEDLVYGAGLGLTLFGHLHARLEYEIIDVSDVDDANVIWVSGAWRF
jgi:OOP family OmpA-OmpF porin